MEDDLFGWDGKSDGLAADVDEGVEASGVTVGDGDESVVAGREIAGEAGQVHAAGVVEGEVVGETAEHLGQDHHVVGELLAGFEREPGQGDVVGPHAELVVAGGDRFGGEGLAEIDVELCVERRVRPATGEQFPVEGAFELVDS